MLVAAGLLEADYHTLVLQQHQSGPSEGIHPANEFSANGRVFKAALCAGESRLNNLTTCKAGKHGAEHIMHGKSSFDSGRPSRSLQSLPAGEMHGHLCLLSCCETWSTLTSLLC